jgi:hypothetical protein
MAAIGFGLQDAGMLGEVGLRVLTAAVARVVEQRRRGARPGEGPVITHIDPQPPGLGASAPVCTPVL